MAESTMPWWRRALEFALNGLRSGFGLFRSNGTADPEALAGSGTENELPEKEPQENELIETSASDEAEPENELPENELPENELIENELIDAGSLNNNESQQERVETGAANSVDPEGALIEAGAQAAVEPEIAADDPVDLSNLEEPSDPEEPEEPAEENELKHPSPQSEQVPKLEQPAAEPAPESKRNPEAEPSLQPASAGPAIEPAPQAEPAPAEPAPAPAAAPPATESVPPAPLAEPKAGSPEAAPPAETEQPQPVLHEPAATAIAETEAASAPAAETVPAQEPAPKLPFPAPPEPAAPTTADKVAAALKARRQDAEQSPFSVTVGQVYEGPLDLLLDLIRKQDIDIYDIPIAKITAQFLAYVDQLRASDMDVAGEFIYTASLLIHIKSRMLLPRAPAAPGEEAEDPRRELVERLLEHERFKNAAQMLQQKQLLEAATWSNPGVREFQDDSAAEPEIAADTGDLVRVFHQILERARNRPMIDVAEDSVTVGQMIQFLARRLTMEDKPVALRRLLSHTRSEQALIALFLALLELVRLQAILLRQDRHFSEIFIKKNTGFDAVLNQGLADARDDWR